MGEVVSIMKGEIMKINTSSECKRWHKAMAKYNKIMGITKKECNRYGICNKQDEVVEFDTYWCKDFKKSKLLSVIQWLYRHRIKAFR